MRMDVCLCTCIIVQNLKNLRVASMPQYLQASGKKAKEHSATLTIRVIFKEKKELYDCLRTKWFWVGVQLQSLQRAL